MRLYISNIKKQRDQRPDIYDFAKSIAGSWFWTTKCSAEYAKRVFGITGIWAAPPFGTGNLCTEFEIEARPEGGFAISCEYPSVSEEASEQNS